MDEKSVENLSAVADFLKKNDDPEYKTTEEIVDGVYGVVNNGLKIADIFTGGFYSGVIDKFNPSKYIDKLPNRFNYANGSREKISLHNYNKFDTANFMIIWMSIAYILLEECQDDTKKEDLDEFQTLLNIPVIFDSERYIKTILPLLTSNDISQKVINSYKANTNSIKDEFSKYKTFYETAYQSFSSDKLTQIDERLENLSPQKPLIPKIITPILGSEQAENFVGREDELQEIEEQLSQNKSLLLINGIGGIGKSALASHYLFIHKEKFDHYGYISVFDDIKANMVSALKSSLNLQAQTIDEDFTDAITKLHNLKGKKLLVIDDIKEVEKQSEVIKTVQGLSGWELLLTSRESIDDITPYQLDRLSLEDARKLFMFHSEVDDKEKIDAVLEYLDRHTLFVELTAKSLKKDRELTLDRLLEMFEKGELPKIRISRHESFNDYLQKRFSLDGLDESQKLLLKKLSLMPSVEIPYESMKSFFEMEDLGWILDELRDKGWLSGDDNKSCKMHQIIKEFILNSHTPIYEEIEDLVEYVNTLLKNSADPQTAVDNRENILYFESIADVLLQKNIENENTAMFFLNVANIYYHLGEYEKALPLYKKALKISEEVLGENHLDTASSYNNLAGLYGSMGEYEKALPLYKKALKIWEEVLGENHPGTATSYNNLAGLYESMGEYEKALPLYKKALKIWEEVLGENHPNTASSYNNLAELYESMGEYEKALPLYKKALKIREEVLGENHPGTATSYNNLAELYRSMGEYEKALPLYKKALKIREEVLGENHPDTASSYNNLAELYRSMGEYEKALPLHKKALKIREEVLGENHPDTASSYNNLAVYYFGLQDYQESYIYMKKAVEILQKVLPASHPNLLAVQKGLKVIQEKLR